MNAHGRHCRVSRSELSRLGWRRVWRQLWRARNRNLDEQQRQYETIFAALELGFDVVSRARLQPEADFSCEAAEHIRRIQACVRVNTQGARSLEELINTTLDALRECVNAH